MKRHSFYTLIGSLMLLILATSCASFPKKQFPSISHINRNNINLLEGTYALKHSYPVYINDSIIDMGFVHDGLNQYSTLFDELNNGVFVKSIKIDTSKQYTFNLKILNSNKMQLNYLENDSIIRSNRIQFRLRKDGYVYLHYRNFKIIGIPYLFGGFHKKRNRLNLTAENNLYFETSEFVSRGMFLVMVVPLNKTEYQKIYKRIN